MHFNARQLLSSRRRARLRWRCCGAELGQEHLNFSIWPWSCLLFFPAQSARLSCSLDYSSWILTTPHPARGGKEGKKGKRARKACVTTRAPLEAPHGTTCTCQRLRVDFLLWAFHVISRGLTLTQHCPGEASPLVHSHSYPLMGSTQVVAISSSLSSWTTLSQQGNTFSPKTEGAPVTKSKLMLLATWQANLLGEGLLWQGIKALSERPADQEECRLPTYTTIFPSQSSVFLYTKRGGSMAGGCKLLDLRILYCQLTDALVNLQTYFHLFQ